MSRREWIGRALFEGAFIALSLVGALVLNEWKEARDGQARVHDIDLHARRLADHYGMALKALPSL
jgi:hypothetical protein